jgi:hypothetical protein
LAIDGNIDAGKTNAVATAAGKANAAASAAAASAKASAALAAANRPLPLRVLRSGLFWTLLITAAIILVMTLSINGLSGQVRDNQAKFVEDAVRRSAVQCYALEGSYPSSIEYLEKNYNLTIDRSRYAVYYESMGSNLLPQIRVIVWGQQ